MRFICVFIAMFVALSAHADDTPGHSKHGSAFDSGMRTRPWEMPGVGDAPFPITSSNPEVQKWFNQGNALLHSFWFEEAERSFRWCLKLDPDCAMAYWGLARCGITWFNITSPSFEGKEFERYMTFLKEAGKRKNSVTPRERMYIEAYEKAVSPKSKDHLKTMCTELEKIAIAYPDDVEAKAMLALFNIGNGSALANESLIQLVLAKNPMHPGAHHASIHNWDSISDIQAINSCELYGKAAPGIGHSLHMPGHIYSKLGMWHEAAIAMDSAARTELRYMNDRLALPFETWNYPHNRNYLCYIQEQLGMANVALQGAKDLLRAPKDPEYNPAGEGGIVMQGREAVVRNLVKFERWKEILEPGFVDWGSDDSYNLILKHFVQSLAHSGMGNTKEAKKSLDALNKLAEKLEGELSEGEEEEVAAADEESFSAFKFFGEIAAGMYSIAASDSNAAEKFLLSAAKSEESMRENFMYANDPPGQPWPVSRLLADFYWNSGKTASAILWYEKSLAFEPNDGFSLAGLALAHHKLGNIESATHFAGRLENVWSNADPDLKWLVAVRKLGLEAKSFAVTPRPERAYVPAELDAIGPMNWSPFKAPKFEATDRSGKPVNLEQFRGQNVLLIYFLGDSCAHCVQQLDAVHKKAEKFKSANTVVVAVCSALPEKLKTSVLLKDMKFEFLSDTNHENARRFASYDDFEEMELHSTILIDKEGRVRWKRTGGDPFMKIDFLLDELKRINSTN